MLRKSFARWEICETTFSKKIFDNANWAKSLIVINKTESHPTRGKRMEEVDKILLRPAKIFNRALNLSAFVGLE